jgi:hypothetical protein
MGSPPGEEELEHMLREAGARRGVSVEVGEREVGEGGEMELPAVEDLEVERRQVEACPTELTYHPTLPRRSAPRQGQRVIRSARR